MKVALGTLTIDEASRRAIADFYGQAGLADRQLVRDFYLGHAAADLQAMTAEWRERHQDKEKPHGRQ